MILLYIIDIGNLYIYVFSDLQNNADDIDS